MMNKILHLTEIYDKIFFFKQGTFDALYLDIKRIKATLGLYHTKDFMLVLYINRQWIYF